MTVAGKLAWLQEHTCSVSIEVNSHRNYYELMETAVAEQVGHKFIEPGRDVERECLARQQLVVVQCYVNTPISFFRVVHWDVEQAIDQMHALVTEDLGTTPKPWLVRDAESKARPSR